MSLQYSRWTEEEISFLLSLVHVSYRGGMNTEKLSWKTIAQEMTQIMSTRLTLENIRQAAAPLAGLLGLVSNHDAS
jgi:hypothetical protein